MSLRKYFAGIIILLSMLVSPRAASAEIWEFIWEMTGPQMQGFISSCKIDVENLSDGCQDGHIVFLRFGDRLDDETRMWLTPRVGYYRSIGKEPVRDGAGVGKIHMISGGAIVDVMSLGSHSDWMTFHGVGLERYQLFGDDVKIASRQSLRIRVGEVRKYSVRNGSTLRSVQDSTWSTFSNR